MMKRSLFPRMVGLFALYIVVLAGLVVVQFTRRTSFTATVGSMVVSGNYHAEEDLKKPATEGSHRLEGGATVYFGGMEFRLFEGEGLSAAGASGGAERLSPQRMTIASGVATFLLSDGSELAFSTHFSGGSETLRIQARYGKKHTELRLPFRPLRSYRVSERADGIFAVTAGGDDYGFTQSSIDAERRTAVIRAKAPVLAYGKIPAKKVFSPGDYILPAAADQASYGRALERWREQSYAQWERAMASGPDEDTVIAYVAESARRNNYRSAVATTPAAFIEDTRRTFRSSAYFGRLDVALRSISAHERETLGRLSRLANEKSPELAAEPNLLSFLAVRGSRALADDAAALARSMDPAGVTAAAAVGILEGRGEWRAEGYPGDNPYDRLLDQAYFVIAGLLRKSSAGAVFAFPADQGDAAYSLRLGLALSRFSDGPSGADWTALGRSLVLSVLSLADQSGAVPAYVQQASDGGFAPASDQQIPAARLYRSLAPEGYYPRALRIQAEGFPGLWTWTAASKVSASVDAGTLSVAVDFPVGETHYMMIRGVRPFAKIQLYDIDFRTDPRFERYDSSGWAYSASEQTLLLKMKHRSPTEYVRIFY